MLLTAGNLWTRINEIVRWLKGIEEKGERTSHEVLHLQREVDIIIREANHNKTVTDFQGRKIVELEAKLKALQSERHGLKVSRGKAKAEITRLRQKINH